MTKSALSKPIHSVVDRIEFSTTCLASAESSSRRRQVAKWLATRRETSLASIGDRSCTKIS